MPISAASMPLQLHPTLSFCKAGDRHVFMDIERDRYFCLDTASEAGFCALLERPGDAASKEIEGLCTDGVLAAGADGRPIEPCPPDIASSSLLDELPGPGWQRHAPLLAWRLARARRDLRRYRLAPLLNGLADMRARIGGTGHDRRAQLSAIAQAFERLSLWTVRHDQCLPRSLALCRYLARRQIAAELVFAVRLDPFKAHCWVEAGGWIVNERVETAMLFTPIRRL